MKNNKEDKGLELVRPKSSGTRSHMTNSVQPLGSKPPKTPDMVRPINGNINNDKTTKGVIKKTIDNLTTTLSRTLGPYGSTTIIEDRINGHIITKDGYTVLNKIQYDNEISKTILDIIKKISRSLVKEVGDGSTSSILVSNELFKGIEQLQKDYKIAPKDILDVLSKLEVIITDMVKEEAIEITEENMDVLSKIASISNNNDENAGDVIFNLYKKIGVNGFITLENSHNENDNFEIKNGIEYDYGYITDIFANQKNRVDCEFEKPFVFMCNDSITEEDMDLLMEKVLGYSMKASRPLVVIAKNYDFEMQNFFKINKQQHRDKFQVVPVQYPFSGSEFYDRFEDVAIYLGGQVYDKRAGMKPEEFTIDMLGECNKSFINEDVTRLIEGQGKKDDIDARIELLNRELKDLSKADGNIDTAPREFELKKRIATLKTQIATLFVGGKTEMERETRKFLMEDATYACQSALKHGYISGGNLVIPRIIKKRKNDIISKLEGYNLCRSLDGENKVLFTHSVLDMVLDSFTKSFHTVLSNKLVDKEDMDDIVTTCVDEDVIFNLISDKYENVENTSIINSCMTDIQIMKASFSIIGLLATSNQFISLTTTIEI